MSKTGVGEYKEVQPYVLREKGILIIRLACILGLIYLGWSRHTEGHTLDILFLLFILQMFLSDFFLLVSDYRVRLFSDRLVTVKRMGEKSYLFSEIALIEPGETFQRTLRLRMKDGRKLCFNYLRLPTREILEAIKVANPGLLSEPEYKSFKIKGILLEQERKRIREWPHYSLLIYALAVPLLQILVLSRFGFPMGAIKIFLVAIVFAVLFNWGAEFVLKEESRSRLEKDIGQVDRNFNFEDQIYKSVRIQYLCVLLVVYLLYSLT